MVGSADFQRQAGALQVMAFKSIAIGADHPRFALKAKLAEELKSAGYDVIDLGPREGITSVAYPDFGRAAAQPVTDRQDDARRRASRPRLCRLSAPHLLPRPP